jgi:predicted GIY-YIG superfamily endonuclease
MIYIGQTKNIEIRDQRHCNDKVMRIDRAIRKYGRQNFLLSIILTSKN